MARRNRKKMSTVSKQLVTKTQVRDMIRSSVQKIEEKYFNSFVSGSTVIGSPYTLLCGDIPQGISDTQRIGDEVKLTRIRYSITFAAGVVSGSVRFVLCQYNSTVLAATGIAGTQVLFDSTGPNNLTSVYNQDQLDGNQLRIIVDRTVVVSTSGQDHAHIEGTVTSGFTHQVQFLSGLTTGIGKVFAFAWTDAASAITIVSVAVTLFYLDA